MFTAKNYIVLDASNIISDSLVTPNFQIREGERITKSDMIQGRILFSETKLTASSLDKDGHLLSDCIKRQGDNPSLKEIELDKYSMPQSKWRKIFLFASICRNLRSLNLSGCNVGEAGGYLAQSIASWGEDPPLQTLDLDHCRIPEQVWPELLQCLSSCKQLSHVNLSKNTIGEAGRHLAQSITSWGDNPPLHQLHLNNCLIPNQACAELLQSLSSCKQLTNLNLSVKNIGEAGLHLAQSITSWGDNPPLHQLDLNNCLIPQQMWAELLQSISSCKQLIDLNLSWNDIGEAGRYLAQSITSWGDIPPLHQLDLNNCLIPEQVWPELLQSISSCKQLIDLNLSWNHIGKAGRYLAQSITSWGDHPPLKTLYLQGCYIQEQACAELLQSLSSCKHLTNMNLSFNDIGKAGRHLTQSITSWGDHPPLKKLDLYRCSIPEQVWAELLQALSSCKQFTDLNLSDNVIGEAGRYLAQSITSWGDHPPLKTLYLQGCYIQEQVWAELLQSLSSCKQLTDLDLSRRTIGQAGRYLVRSITSWGDAPPLKKLDLSWCSIPEQVWPELLQSLSSCKQLTNLNLSENTIGEAGCYLAYCITSWGDNPALEELNLGYCSMPEQVCAELLQSLSSCKQLTDLDLSLNEIGEAGCYLVKSITSW